MLISTRQGERGKSSKKKRLSVRKMQPYYLILNSFLCLVFPLFFRFSLLLLFKNNLRLKVVKITEMKSNNKANSVNNLKVGETRVSQHLPRFQHHNMSGEVEEKKFTAIS